MTNISVEIGHIYQDMELTEHYGAYLKKSQAMIEEFNYQNQTTKLLIDDLNIKEKRWNENELIDFLDKHKINIDVLVYESKFRVLAEQYLTDIPNESLITERFRRDEKSCLFLVKDDFKIKVKTIYDDGRIEYSCPLLSALWQLCRLGVYKFPDDSYYSINEKSMIACKTMTVIEEKYKFVEKQVIELIEYKVNKNHVTHCFI